MITPLKHLIFPLPLWAHIIFVAVSTLLLIFCYSKKKQKYHLYLIIGIISTLLVYIAHPKIIFYILGIEEFALLGLAVYDQHRYEKQEELREKQLAEAASAEENSEPDNRSTDIKDNVTT